MWAGPGLAVAWVCDANGWHIHVVPSWTCWQGGQHAPSPSQQQPLLPGHVWLLQAYCCIGSCLAPCRQRQALLTGHPAAALWAAVNQPMPELGCLCCCLLLQFPARHAGCAAGPAHVSSGSHRLSGVLPDRYRACGTCVGPLQRPFWAQAGAGDCHTAVCPDKRAAHPSTKRCCAVGVQDTAGELFVVSKAVAAQTTLLLLLTCPCWPLELQLHPAYVEACLCTALCPAAHGLAVCQHLVQGAAAAAYASAGPGMAADICCPASRGTLFGICSVAALLGPVLGPPLGGGLSQVRQQLPSSGDVVLHDAVLWCGAAALGINPNCTALARQASGTTWLTRVSRLLC